MNEFKNLGNDFKAQKLISALNKREKKLVYSFLEDEEFVKVLPDLLTKEELGDCFLKAAELEDINLIKFFLASPDLSVHADIHYKKEDALFRACYHGALNIVQYLLTSPDLKEHAYINERQGNCFVYACENDHLEVARYLLTSSELKEHANIHSQNDYAFRTACQYKRKEVLEFLIFEMDIEITEPIQEYLSHNYTFVSEAEEMLEKRELYKSLNKDMKTNKAEGKRIKI